MEQAQAVSAALEHLHQASQGMGVQGIHGMGMQLPPGHSLHEQAMQLPLQHQVGVSGLAPQQLLGAGLCSIILFVCMRKMCAAGPDRFHLCGCPSFALWCTDVE